MSALRGVCRNVVSGASRLTRLRNQAPATLPFRQPSVSPISSRFLSTSSDTELKSALNNEILHEEGSGTVSADSTFHTDLADFSRSVTGSTIALLKQFAPDETIKVELDLNNMTELAPAEDDPEETPPQYLPSFKIEITKPQGKVIFFCNYHMRTEEQSIDQYIISEVAYLATGGDEKTIYTTDFGNLDYVLIEEFENYLSRRGLGASFSSALFEMSSTFEHDHYINLLKNVRDFLN